MQTKEEQAKCAEKFAKNVERLMAVTGNKKLLTREDLIDIMQALGLTAEHKVE